MSLKVLICRIKYLFKWTMTPYLSLIFSKQEHSTISCGFSYQNVLKNSPNLRLGVLIKKQSVYHYLFKAHIKWVFNKNANTCHVVFHAKMVFEVCKLATTSTYLYRCFSAFSIIECKLRNPQRGLLGQWLASLLLLTNLKGMPWE